MARETNTYKAMTAEQIARATAAYIHYMHLANYFFDLPATRHNLETAWHYDRIANWTFVSLRGNSPENYYDNQQAALDLYNESYFEKQQEYRRMFLRGDK